ncbi:MAG: type II toxin-antitoxin system VapC family toxin [Ignavibacteria bacterium]|nr:type II toxin-antitoxin system VapC family toxin [Ignavibacteriota bacterium]
MKRYVFDSCSLISYLDGEPNAFKVSDYLEQINEKGLDAFLCVINLGEIYYHFLRTGGESTGKTVLEAIRTLPLKIAEANIELTLSAGRIKAYNKMSYADCFAAALTANKKGVLITSDNEFRQIEKNIKIEFL